MSNYDVFLSHNTRDKPMILELANALRQRGYKPWLDIEQIAPGALFQDEIEKGMNASGSAIAAYGEAGSGPWQGEEVRVLLQQSVTDGKPVIPLILPDAPDLPKMPAFLKQRNWLDLRDNGLSRKNINALIWGITGKKPKEDEEPERRPPVAPPIPKPPSFYAEPPYLGSHEFVGRKAELETLDDWASPADPHPMLLFEAIGGTGKSMLTWHWINNHAADIRAGDDEWAGQFWYSFYEKGAQLASFCRYALAYMTGQPEENFRKQKTLEMAEQLLGLLREKPWLIVLDGLERILVAYNRSDAAQLVDEAAENPEDKIADRDPCAAIRPEDDELLKAFSAAAPSKLLLTSRLTPRAMLNRASQAIPGVLHEQLPGLRPVDAEALLRSDSCGNITGDSGRIRSYLQDHCGCHPLVIGVLAGLINQPAPWRGDFDAWEKAPDGGGQLNLAKLDLIQKRNHILEAALAILPEKGRALLSTLALLSEAADAELLHALNPHLPPEPDVVPEPKMSEVTKGLSYLSDEEKKKAELDYSAALKEWKAYKNAVEKRLASREFQIAPQLLWETVADLEARGFLQYEYTSKRYDLHPVLRGIVAGGLGQEETEAFGGRVVDHFSGRPHDPWMEAESIEDVQYGLQVVRTLLRMGRRQAAYDAWHGDLNNALLANLEAHGEVLALLGDFFRDGWNLLPDGLFEGNASYLANSAAGALSRIGQFDDSLKAYSSSLRDELERGNCLELRVRLSNIATSLAAKNHLAPAHRLRRLTLDLAENLDSEADLFMARLRMFKSLMNLGKKKEAEVLWEELVPLGRHWPRSLYRLGDAEYSYAVYSFWQGKLTEDVLQHAELLAEKGKNRQILRELHTLRGEWHLERGEPEIAAEYLHEAVRMARESGLNRKALNYETWLALARIRAGQLAGEEIRQEAERLTKAGCSNRPLALLWLELGVQEMAKRHALKAYRWAWADGEPYVRRYELERTRAILNELGEPRIDLPNYDPDKDLKFDWEADVEASIATLKTGREAKEKAETRSGIWKKFHP